MTRDLIARIEPVHLERQEDGFRSAQLLCAASCEAVTVVMRRYFEWLDSRFHGFVSVVEDSASNSVVFFFLGAPAIRLKRLGGSDEGVAYAVAGGFLAKPGGNFLFIRKQDGRLLAVLDGFRPRLPGWLYARTHARLHTLVMERFSRTLLEEL